MERELTKEKFYGALEELRDYDKKRSKILSEMGIDVGEGPIASLLETPYTLFQTFCYGPNFIDEGIYDAISSDTLEYYAQEPPEVTGIDEFRYVKYVIPYERYYDYFIGRDEDKFQDCKYLIVDVPDWLRDSYEK